MITQKPVKKNSLQEWLMYCETLHIQEIDLGLDRVMRVRAALGLEFLCPVIVVAGTNGKGSTCAMLESIFDCAGYKTGVFSSPHLIRFEERCRIQRQMVCSEDLLPHFAAVEKARYDAGEEGGPVSLSYFEFTTLVILRHMSQQGLDVSILEVGLGGRLDAVNIIDNDCAVITSIDVDHTHFLGNTREAIALEKAGIMRTGKPVVIGDPTPPQNMLDYAEQLGAQVWQCGKNFKYSLDSDQTTWTWTGRFTSLQTMRLPALAGAHQLLNAAGVLAAIEALRADLPVGRGAIEQGLAAVSLTGRFEVVHKDPTVILDVGHNPHAAKVLSENLKQMGEFSHTYAVFGAMRDKDIAHILEQMMPEVDKWFFTDLPLPRAISAAALQEMAESIYRVRNKSLKSKIYQKPSEALYAAFKEAKQTDRIIVFGSFYVVGGVLDAGLASQLQAEVK